MEGWRYKPFPGRKVKPSDLELGRKIDPFSGGLVLEMERRRGNGLPPPWRPTWALLLGRPLVGRVNNCIYGI